MNVAILILSAAALAAQLQPPPPAPNPVTEIRGLVQAKLWDQVDARVDAIPADDPAWEKLPAIIYSAGITRQDLPAVIAKLSRVAASTTKPANKSAALMVVGRVHRRQGDRPAAVRALQDAKAAAPGTDYAEEADGLIYEIEHLSPGLAAPAIAGKPRNGPAIDMARLRGKPVVLVFWGST